MTKKQNFNIIRETVRNYYGGIAQSANPIYSPAECQCFSDGNSCCQSVDGLTMTIGANNYTLGDSTPIPAEITGLSLGCGDPVTLASLQPGQTVLDLGSGGGMDCFLAASRVGPAGKVIGVDMTAEMIALARSNQERLGIINVEFHQAEIEHLPLADNLVDVIISNCVINLSTNKPGVFQEAYRVLKPGGMVAFSDIVTVGALANDVKNDLNAWSSCLSGALDVGEFYQLLKDVGFINISITPTSVDEAQNVEVTDQKNTETKEFDEPAGPTQFFSAKITARKPIIK